MLSFQVDIEINGEAVDLHMKLGDNGEAFFVEENPNMEVGGVSPSSCFTFILFNYFVSSFAAGPSLFMHLPDSARAPRRGGGGRRRDARRRVWCSQKETAAQARALGEPPERGGQHLVRGERSGSTGQSCVRGDVHAAAAQVTPGKGLFLLIY